MTPRPAFAQTLDLPCGVRLKNRLAKAAMTEGLADAKGHATEAHNRLYRSWAQGGAGLLITGNVQVDGRHLERAGNVVIGRDLDAEARQKLSSWAQAGTENDTHLWMQISHAGRQTPKAINPHPAAPSPIALRLPGGQFGQPREITASEIKDVQNAFVTTAKIARDCGFTGVQIHGAHGYLLSSFLSPLANRRKDEWGGSLRNRARLLLDIVRDVREAVGADFPLSVKLNSADFQRGGFEADDSLQVAAWLDELGIDLLEISGGSYEQPKMMDIKGIESAAESTRAREAYFLDYAVKMRSAVKAPLMVTGGFRSASAMHAAVAEDGIAVIGLGRPLCTHPDAPKQLIEGEMDVLPRWEQKLRLGPGLLGPTSKWLTMRALNGFAVQAWYYRQLVEMGKGKAPDLELSPLKAFIAHQRAERAATRALRF